MPHNRNASISLMLTFFLVSMIFASTISSDYNVSEDDNTESKPIIDYSLLEDLSEGYNPDYTLSTSRSFAVLRVSFDDAPSMRYTKAETLDLFNNVGQFYNEATYSGADFEFTIFPEDGGSFNIGHQSDFNDGNYMRCADWWMAQAGVAEAVLSGVSLSGFDGVVVIHSGNREPGCSSAPKRIEILPSGSAYYHADTGHKRGFSWTESGDGDASITYVGENDGNGGDYSPDNDMTVWSRIAHEIGHALGLPHLAYDYQICHDIMGSTCAYPVLPSSWSRQMDTNPGLQSLDPETDFTTVSVGFSEYTLAELNEDPSDLPSGLEHQVLKIPISSDGSFYYLVEVRYGTLSDALLPIPSEGVMIYRVNEWSSWDPDNDSTWEDTYTVFWGTTSNRGAVTVMDSSPGDRLSNAAWVGGQKFEDVDYGVEIEIISLNDAEYTASVEVNFNPPDSPPADIHISPWGQPPATTRWETTDIWIDSLLNNNDVNGLDLDGNGICDVECDVDWDGYDTDSDTFAQSYRDSVTGHSHLPLGQGDSPWVGEENRFYVEISNRGGTTLSNGMVKVEFQWKKPEAGGVADSWTTIGMIVCGNDVGSIGMQTGTGKCLEGDDFPEQSTETNQLLPGESMIVYIEWTPTEDDFPEDSGVDASVAQTYDVHSCIRAIVEPVGDEPSIKNNEAQENIDFWETSPGSPYHPINGTISVGNPFTTDAYGILSLTGLPIGWDSNMSWEEGYLSVNESFVVEWIITPEEGYPIGQVADIEFSLTFFKPDNATYSDHGHEYVVGGVTNRIATVDRTLVDSTANSQRPGSINIVGSLDPYGTSDDVIHFPPDTSVAIVLTSPEGRNYISSISTNTDGDFSTEIKLSSLASDEAIMTEGQWTSRVYYDGDAYHRSAWGESQVVIVEPEPITPDIGIEHTLTIGDDFLTSGTLTTPIYPGSDLSIIYTSPSGEVFKSSVYVDEAGKYSDSLKMNETGEWSVDYEYTDHDGNLHSWSETVTVVKESSDTSIPGFTGIMTMIAMLSAVMIHRRRYS